MSVSGFLSSAMSVPSLPIAIAPSVSRPPFVNLPEPKSGRWGAGLTAAKMKDCRWVKPVLVAQIEFLEWTGEHHLRHTKFIALREDKPAREVSASSHCR
jgi:ATP-dependent DNA ligase